MRKTQLLEENTTGKNASFVAIYARGITPWINDESLPQEARETSVSGVLVLNRWDGRSGFLGGNVDQGETIVEGAVRETLEEGNYTLKEDELKPICSHNFQAGRNTLSTHLFAKEVSVKELFEIQANIVNGRDYGSEIFGSNIVLLGDFGRGKGLPKYLGTPMATTVKEELMELIISEKLMTEEDLTKCCETAELKLEDLILTIES